MASQEGDKWVSRRRSEFSGSVADDEESAASVHSRFIDSLKPKVFVYTTVPKPNLMLHEAA
jgi:hypothetical protein